MLISRVDLVNWRNHRYTRVDFSPGVNVFVGPNGQGKTNIAEAIRYLSTLSSHRVSATHALIESNATEATIHATVSHAGRTAAIGLVVKKKGSAAAIVNGQKAKVSDIPSWVSVVMFAPEDVSLIRGEPGVRRQFMDELITAASPALVSVVMDYERVVRQRNSLLKTLRSSRRALGDDSLAVWDEKVAELGGRIMFERVSYVHVIGAHFGEHYATLAHGDHVTLAYRSPLADTPLDPASASVAGYRELLLEALRSRRTEEIERGQTLCGPHRDDMDVLIAGNLARTHASQGEAWSLAIALRMAVAQWVRDHSSSGDPIIILDDVFAELDASRRKTLLALVKNYEQLIVTAAVEDDLPEGLGGVRWDVRAGAVVPR